MSNLINTGSKNIPASQLVEGKKYQLVMIYNGIEYPQGVVVFRGTEGKDLKWEHTNRNGRTELKALPANSLVYRNVAGGSRKGRGSLRSSRKGSRKNNRKNKRNTMRR